MSSSPHYSSGKDPDGTVRQHWIGILASATTNDLGQVIEPSESLSSPVKWDNDTYFLEL